MKSENYDAAKRLPYIPVFIGGVARSGTTMLSALVSTSESCSPFAPEFHYLGMFCLALPRALASYAVTQGFFFRSKEMLLKLHFEFVERVLDEAWLALGQPTYLVIKHCKLTPLFGLFAKHFSDARFLVIHRDARDVVASRVRAAAKQGRLGAVSHPAEIDLLIEEFNGVYGAILSDSGAELKGRLLALRLEEVAAGHVEPLSRFLGVSDIDPERLWQRAITDIRDSRNSHMFSRHWGQPLTTEIVDTYRGTLDEQTAERIRWATQGVTTGFAALARDSQSLAFGRKEGSSAAANQHVDSIR